MLSVHLSTCDFSPCHTLQCPVAFPLPAACPLHDLAAPDTCRCAPPRPSLWTCHAKTFQAQCTRKYVCMNTLLYIYIYIYPPTHTHTQTHNCRMKGSSAVTDGSTVQRLYIARHYYTMIIICNYHYLHESKIWHHNRLGYSESYAAWHHHGLGNSESCTAGHQVRLYHVLSGDTTTVNSSKAGLFDMYLSTSVAAAGLLLLLLLSLSCLEYLQHWEPSQIPSQP